MLSHVQLFEIPWTAATRLLYSWNFPVKNTKVGCHFLLQGLFLTQGSSLHILHWQADSLPLNHQGSPSAMINWGLAFIRDRSLWDRPV